MTYKKTNTQVEDNITDVMFAHMNGYICSEAAIGALNYIASQYPDFANLCFDGVDEILIGDSHEKVNESLRSTTLTLVK